MRRKSATRSCLPRAPASEERAQTRNTKRVKRTKRRMRPRGRGSLSRAARMGGRGRQTHPMRDLVDVSTRMTMTTRKKKTMGLTSTARILRRRKRRTMRRHDPSA